MILFISGKYRGDIEHNIWIARQVGMDVWRHGHTALCPHMNSAFMDGLVPDEAFLAGDLELLGRCDGIVMIPDWEQSEGAKAEWLRAIDLGMPCWTWPDLPPPDDEVSRRLVLPELMGQLQRRIAKGVRTYGCHLRTNNHRDAVKDALEEALDLSLYVTQALMEVRHVDMDAGAVTQEHMGGCDWSDDIDPDHDCAAMDWDGKGCAICRLGPDYGEVD